MRSRGAVSACAVIATAFIGCDTVLSDADEFVIQVDSIVAPAAIESTDKLHLAFHGRVGPDACSRVKAVERSATSDSLELRFVGERVRGTCAQMPSTLEHTESLAPPLTVRRRSGFGDPVPADLLVSNRFLLR